MSEINRIVDEVRAFVAARDQTLSERMRILADDYAQACKQAEARLRRCEEFARSGYRGEALYLAELEPPLLDVLSWLSFPERRDWSELTSHYGLTEAPRLSVARAKGLNQIYSEYSAIEPSVRRLRHLNRNRAPVGERAEVLRLLCSQDPNCPVWPEQLIALEAVIREDVVRCMDADIAVGERGRMAEYYSALTAPGWRKPALPPVISRAATEYLPQALSRFTLALKSPDLQNAQRLRTACDQVVRAAILAPGHPLLDRFAVLSMKLSQLEQQSAEEQCREESVELLQQTVRRGATEKELDRAYEHAKQTGAQIPKGLQGRFDDAMHKHEGRRTIKQVILGVIGISLGTVALVVFLVMVLKK